MKYLIMYFPNLQKNTLFNTRQRLLAEHLIYFLKTLKSNREPLTVAKKTNETAKTKRKKTKTKKNHVVCDIFPFSFFSQYQTTKTKK